MYDPQERTKKAIQSEIAAKMSQTLNSENRAIVGQLKSFSDATHFKVLFEFHVQSTKADPWGLLPCCNKSDVDNYIKFFLDCCNSVLYDDDHKVVEVSAKKVYSPFPKTIMDIEPMTLTKELSNSKKQVLKVFTPAECCEFLDDIANFQEFSSAQLDDMPHAEWEKWVSSITEKKLKFAKKWGSKLQKLANKIKDDDV